MGLSWFAMMKVYSDRRATERAEDSALPVQAAVSTVDAEWAADCGDVPLVEC